MGWKREAAHIGNGEAIWKRFKEENEDKNVKDGEDIVVVVNPVRVWRREAIVKKKISLNYRL